MTRKRKITSVAVPNVGVASEAKRARPPVEEISHKAVVEFVASDSFISRLIGGGWREFWAHMTQHVAPGLVIDSRSEVMFAPDEWCGNFNPPERWVRTNGGWYIPPGVQYRPARYLASNAYSLKLAIPCTQVQHEKWIGLMVSQLGEPYDMPGIIARSMGKTFDPDWRGAHHPFFCNAFGIWSLQNVPLIRPTMEAPFGRAPGAACDMVMTTNGSHPVSCRGKIVEDMMTMAGFDVNLLREAI